MPTGRTVSRCLESEGIEFIVVANERLSFENARNRCKELGEGLGMIKNSLELTFVKMLLKEAEVETDTLIGMIDFRGENGFGESVDGFDPSRFSFDGIFNNSELAFIHRENGEFPWSPGRPEPEEFCGAIRNEDGLLTSTRCPIRRPFLCYKSCSISNTNTNTDSPSLSTSSPSLFPSSSTISVEDPYAFNFSDGLSIPESLRVAMFVTIFLLGFSLMALFLLLKKQQQDLSQLGQHKQHTTTTTRVQQSNISL